jgi:hypothetical protein
VGYGKVLHNGDEAVMEQDCNCVPCSKLSMLVVATSRTVSTRLYSRSLTWIFNMSKVPACNTEPGVASLGRTSQISPLDALVIVNTSQNVLKSQLLNLLELLLSHSCCCCCCYFGCCCCCIMKIVFGHNADAVGSSHPREGKASAC